MQLRSYITGSKYAIAFLTTSAVLCIRYNLCTSDKKCSTWHFLWQSEN